MTDNSEIIVAFVTGVIGPASLLGIKHYLDVRKAKRADIIKHTCEINRDIENRIEKARGELS